MSSRYDIINKIIRDNNFKKYLEIGVCNPANCFNLIDCEVKDGVDPGIEFENNPVKYKLTSDEFFQLLESDKLDIPSDYKWDVIFIDGLHIAPQAFKDLKNSLNHLSDGGYILTHDTNPSDIFRAREDYKINGEFEPWNGTVWKIMYWVRTHRNDIQTCTLNTDEGIGVYKKGISETIPFDNIFFEYNEMDANRELHLGLLSVDEFDSWILKNN
jgi:hypothetical protein